MALPLYYSYLTVVTSLRASWYKEKQLSLKTMELSKLPYKKRMQRVPPLEPAVCYRSLLPSLANTPNTCTRRGRLIHNHLYQEVQGSSSNAAVLQQRTGTRQNSATSATPGAGSRQQTCPKVYMPSPTSLETQGIFIDSKTAQAN